MNIYIFENLHLRGKNGIGTYIYSYISLLYCRPPQMPLEVCVTCWHDSWCLVNVLGDSSCYSHEKSWITNILSPCRKILLKNLIFDKHIFPRKFINFENPKNLKMLIFSDFRKFLFFPLENHNFQNYFSPWWKNIFLKFFFFSWE